MLADMTQEDDTLLDKLLAEAPAPAASRDVKQNLLAAFDEVQRGRRQINSLADLRDLFDRFRFASAGAFAALSVLGVGVGVLTANASYTLTPEDELYIYAEDIFAVALLEQEGIDQWERD